MSASPKCTHSLKLVIYIWIARKPIRVSYSLCEFAASSLSRPRSEGSYIPLRFLVYLIVLLYGRSWKIPPASLVSSTNNIVRNICLKFQDCRSLVPTFTKQWFYSVLKKVHDHAKFEQSIFSNVIFGKSLLTSNIPRLSNCKNYSVR